MRYGAKIECDSLRLAALSLLDIRIVTMLILQFAICIVRQRRSAASVMKVVAELYIDLRRVVVMESAEREAIINQHMAIGDVERVDRH